MVLCPKAEIVIGLCVYYLNTDRKDNILFSILLVDSTGENDPSVGLYDRKENGDTQKKRLMVELEFL